MLPSQKDLEFTYKILPFNLPIRLNKRKWFSSENFYLELAYFIGKSMGDGHISKNLGHITFTDASKKNLQKLMSVLMKEFKIEKNKFKIILKKAWGKAYVLKVSDALFARLLFSSGASKGNKVNTKFNIPKWILHQTNYSLLFLQAILEDELTTIKIEKKNYSVNPQFKMAKKGLYLKDHKIFMNEVKSLIESFSVSCGDIRKIKSNKKAKTWDLYFHIHRNKQNIIKFKENIGFRFNRNKINEMKKCYKILKNTLRPPIDKFKIYDLRKYGLSIRQIALISEVSRSHIHRILQAQNL